jgi:phenylalanyl-tRNA synthetase beta chain
MRQSLLFGGLEAIAYNSNRQRPNLRFYEFGKTYRKVEEKYAESSRLGIWISGVQKPETWNSVSQKTDFYTLKSEILNMLAQLGFEKLQEEEVNTESVWEYGLNLILNNRVIASFGKVKNALQKQMDIRQEVFFADLDWDYIAKKAKKLKIQFKELPKYPEVRRDLALLVNNEVKYADLKTAAQKSEKKILRDISLFDVYEGKNLDSGKKSYALSFILRDDEKTLKDEHVDKVMNKILSSFKAQFQAELR